MTLSFLIKKIHIAGKMKEQEETGIFHERRAYVPFWRKRIGSVHTWDIGDTAVFLCGRYSFMADILKITLDETPQGIAEVVPSDLCYNIECKFLQEELEGLSIFLSE